MILRQGIAVADVGVVHAVQEHVHAADAQHGVVEIEAVEHGLVEVLAQLAVVQEVGLALAQEFAGRDQKAGSAAGRVADQIGGLRRGHLDHEADDVAGRAELAVLPGAGDLAQHVLVEIALGVAILHGHVVEQVHHLGQERGRGNGEARVLHVLGIGRAVAAQVAQERKDVLADYLVHLGRGEVLELAPAEFFVGAPAVLAAAILALGKHPPLHRLLQPRGLVFFQGVQVVQPAQEEQVGDLLDDLQWVGDAAGPEGIPDRIDLALDFTGHHVGWCPRCDCTGA